MEKTHTDEASGPIPVREGEELDGPRVEAYLRAHLPGLEGPMELLQFPGGHANLTYLARFGSREVVLRRPPLGPVAPRSHDMAREYRVLSRLAPHYPPAPRPYLLCEDRSVTGAVFFAMERRQGVIVRDRVPPSLDRHERARERMSFALVDALADLHSVNFEAIGLGDLGRPEGYTERQLLGWKERWEAARTLAIPEFDAVFEWLVANRPESPAPALVHNDWKLDNAMLDPDDPGRVRAILDWDMTTLGDPLVDLGTLLGYWIEPGDPPGRAATRTVTAEPGFPPRAALAERYAQRRGVDVSALPWYEIFAVWKTAVVLEQIHVRWVRGQTRDPRFAALGRQVPALVREAARLTREGPTGARHPGGMLARVKHEEERFETAGGLRLFEQRWRPDSAPRAALGIVHGYAEHSGRYAWAARGLAAAGYAVFALDLRGHGRSEGPRACVRRFDEHLGDVDRFVARIRARERGRLLFLLGHSMGGTICTLWAIRRDPEIAGMILSGPGLAPVAKISALRVWSARAVARLFPRLPVMKLSSRDVSRDPEVVARYESDPLVYHGGFPASTAAAALRAFREIQAGMERFALPVLILHGTADRLTDPQGSRDLHRRCASADRTLQLYEGLYHEVLNEPEREQVLTDVLRWLDAHTPPD